MRRAVLALAIMTVGCGRSGDDECQPRSGLYRVTYTVKSGNCGPINEVIVNLSGGSSQQSVAACMGMTLAADQCMGGVDFWCPIPGRTEVMAARGSLTFADDGSRGNGELYIELRAGSGAVLCNGIYQVRYTRL